MKTLTLTALGLSGREWIERLEKGGYTVGSYARSVLESPEYEKHCMKKGEEITVSLVSVKDTGKEYATTKKIQDYALSKGLGLPKAELSLLIREAVSDKQMEDMGFWYIASLHDPIKDSDGDPSVLDADRFGGGPWVNACWANPDAQWGDGGAFAFPVSASTSNSETESSSDVEREKLKSLFLANFADGDSWEDADALSLTKHGALDVAEFFYAEGHRAVIERVVEKIDERIDEKLANAEGKMDDETWAKKIAAIVKNAVLSDLRTEITKML